MATGSYSRLCVDNVAHNEVVHQRCLLITGTCHDFSAPADDGAPGPDGVPGLAGGPAVEDFVVVRTRDAFATAAPPQNWPAARGAFRCLVMLQPGPNTVEVRLSHAGRACGFATLTVRYEPLLQLPPLHLAVLVAKDSPLLIDCPAAKQGAVSSAHAGLDAAVAKLRTTAYMWQAYLGEDLRRQGLGRRAFRLDEAWAADTTQRAAHAGDLPMAAVATVHVVRSEHTVEQLRNPDWAQQNHRGAARDELLRVFERALAAHGPPFVAAARPVVAGLVLDAHYAPERDLILGHAALASHRPDGLSLGMVGSHLTYAWPRFLDEVPDCLLDARPPGDGVAHDQGQCPTMGAACGVGQGALLAVVARAFGAAGAAGADARAFARRWGDGFLAAPGAEPVRWPLADALVLRARDHFRLPGDATRKAAERDAPVRVRCVLDDAGEPVLEITCQAGLAQVRLLSGGDEVRRHNWCAGPSQGAPPTVFHVDHADLVRDLDRRRPCRLEVLGAHGKAYTQTNVWALLADQPFLKVPGTTLVLAKRSVKCLDLARGTAPRGRDDDDAERDVPWALLLRRRRRRDAPAGGPAIAHATRIDLRIGCILDGAVVYYSDGSQQNMGLPDQRHYGGHQSADRQLTAADSFAISRVAVGRGGGHNLGGVRMTIDGSSWGHKNGGSGGVERLAPGPDERIVGFYGRSDSGGYMRELGIITAPRDVVDGDEGLPMQLYDMPELMNLPTGQGGGGGGGDEGMDVDSEEEEEDEEDSNDEDNDSDVDAEESEDESME